MSDDRNLHDFIFEFEKRAKTVHVLSVCVTVASRLIWRLQFRATRLQHAAAAYECRNEEHNNNRGYSQESNLFVKRVIQWVHFVSEWGYLVRQHFLGVIGCEQQIKRGSFGDRAVWKKGGCHCGHTSPSPAFNICGVTDRILVSMTLYELAAKNNKMVYYSESGGNSRTKG